MEIRPATNQPGMFYLIWNDSGVEGGPRFTKIETVDGKPSQDAILMNGMQHVETLHIQSNAVTPFLTLQLMLAFLFALRLPVKATS